MACGTPVIATARGSMPEIIRDGENGFLVASLDEAVAAVASLERLDRKRRASVGRARFAVDRMVDDYLASTNGLELSARHRPATRQRRPG